MPAIIESSQGSCNKEPLTFKQPFPLIKGNTIYFNNDCNQYIKVLSQEDDITREQLSIELKAFRFNFSELAVNQLKNLINSHYVGGISGVSTIEQLTENNRIKEEQAEAEKKEEALKIQEKVDYFTAYLESFNVSVYEVIEYVRCIVSGKAMYEKMRLKDEKVNYLKILNQYSLENGYQVTSLPNALYFKCMQDMKLI